MENHLFFIVMKHLFKNFRTQNDSIDTLRFLGNNIYFIGTIFIFINKDQINIFHDNIIN